MNKFAVNYNDVKTQLNQKKKYRLADVKDRLQKVAFDVVRFVDSDKLDDLWKVERDGDDEYIVAMYDDQVLTSEASSVPVNDWKVLPDKVGNIHVFYKEAPIKKISLASLNISQEDAYSTCKLVKEKLASSQTFLRKFVNELTETERDSLAEVNPTILGK